MNRSDFRCTKIGPSYNKDMSKRNQAVRFIDVNATSCARCAASGAVASRMEYTFATRYATAKCLKPGCHNSVSFDTTRDVKQSMKSLEQARGWFQQVYG